MGEYIQYQGHTIKLGTCENLYYCTYQQLYEIVADPTTKKLSGNCHPREYLNPELGWRYRFPFPDEDNWEPGQDYDRGVIVDAPEGWEMEHRDIWVSVGPQHHKTHNVNARVRCPMADDADPGMYSPRTGIVEVVQQKIVSKQLWTILRCPYCEARWRINAEEAAELADHIRKMYPRSSSADPFLREIADRIEAGYQPGALDPYWTDPADACHMMD